MAEFVKLIISICLHVADFEDHRGGPKIPLADRIASAKSDFLECIGSQPTSALHLFSLAFLYLFNNQLNFYTNGEADPGTIYLFKSGSTLITALMLWFFLGRKNSDLQWGAIFMQVTGLFVVQYDPCKGQAVLPIYLYFLMALSTTISSTTAVRNDYMLKNFKMSMHVQNIILYT
jgi:drug/metabolite transporter (DMT)-like permease